MTAQPGNNQRIDQEVFLEDLQALRETVLKTSLWLIGIGIPSISIIIMLQVYLRDELTALAIYYSAFTLSLPLLACFQNKIPFKIKASGLLFLLVGISFLVSTRGGFSAGNMIVSVLALILATLFFGRKGALITFSSLFLVFLIAGYMMMSGSFPPPEATTWDPLGSNYWIRQLVIFIVLGTCLLYIQIFINERLIALTANTRLLAEQDKQQRVALAESRRIESLSRMSGGIAHDFNNTLTVMIGNAELAMMELDEKHPARENIRKILDSGQSASEMTRQLLTIGRKETSSPELFNLQEVLEKVSASLQRLLPAYVDLEIEVIGDPDIYADPGMFQRVLYNLILNARDAMPDGGLVSIYCIEDTDVMPDFVKIVVSDNGMGMDEETLAQVFDPFFTTKGEEGTGLGLAILNAWVSNSGGRITVESAEGKGTTFTLWLLTREPVDLNL